MRLSLTIVLVLVSSIAVCAQGELKMLRIDAPPTIDGVLSVDEWTQAAKAELNFQVFPVQDDTPASEKTTAYVTLSHRAFARRFPSATVSIPMIM